MHRFPLFLSNRVRFNDGVSTVWAISAVWAMSRDLQRLATRSIHTAGPVYQASEYKGHFSGLNENKKINSVANEELSRHKAWNDHVICPSWDRGGQTKSNALTPLYSSIRKLIDNNKGSVCLVQVGSFYELYFEQAILIAPKLGIRVATRQTNNHSVPMAGFPVAQLQKNVKIIVQDLGLNVAIIDQYNSVKTDTDLKHRRVSRIVSPGTLVDESFMNYSKNNYLVAISFPPSSKLIPDPDLEVGILWADISVGDFFIQQTTLSDLAGDLRRINPSEVILPKDFQNNTQAIEKMAELKRYFVRYHKVRYNDHKMSLEKDPAVLRKFLESLSVREEAAMNLVLSYMTYNLPDRQLLLGIPSRFVNSKYLSMDPRTREALELVERSTYGTASVSGTLWLILKNTVTASGTRLLTQWLNLPLLDKSVLNERQEYVMLLKEDLFLRTKMVNILKDVNDFVRSLQKLALKSGSAAAHFQSISDGLFKLQLLRECLEDARRSTVCGEKQKLLTKFLSTFKVPIEIMESINSTLVFPDPPRRPKVANTIDMSLEDQLISAVEDTNHTPAIYRNMASDENETVAQGPVFVVRKDYNKKLKKLHQDLDKLKTLEASLLKEVEKIVLAIDPKGIVSQKEKLGKHFHVITVQCSLKNIAGINKAFEECKDVLILEKRKLSTVLKPIKWTEILEKRDVLVNQILEYERKIIEALRLETLKNMNEIRDASRASDFLDVIASFAKVAHENQWVRPTFSDYPVIDVKQGRHPVVEASLKSSSLMFVLNDTSLGIDGKLWVILGPNMGGKSTFLRQNALFVILAQMGSFVPAANAHLGLVDRLFTRIGASDDLYSDLSTFMVEMTEISYILANASKNSLAIVDEIGRGTSGNEGLAISYASLLSLVQDNQCRTLFATHYGKELIHLLEKDQSDQSDIRFYKTKVEKRDGKLVFDRKLEPGISERSYAIEVAQLAGFPKLSLEHAIRAQNILKQV